MTMTKEEALALADLLDAKVRWDSIPAPAPAITQGMVHAATRAAAALRQLVEERDREDRLLRVGWSLSMRKSNSQGWLWRWITDKDGPLTWVEHPARAEAARLTEERMND